MASEWEVIGRPTATPQSEWSVIAPGSPAAAGMTHPSRRPTYEQQAQQELGAPFESGGMQDFGMRADLSLSDTLEEKTAKFKSKYPDGDLRAITTKDVRGKPYVSVVFRKSPAEAYRELDPSVIASGLAGLEYGDVADLLGDLPSLLGGLAAGIATGGAGTVPMLLAAGAGAAGGEIAKEGVELARGFSREDASEVGARALTLGAGEMLGGVATLPLSGAVNLVKGAGLVKATPAGQERMAAGQRLGLPDLMPPQVSDNPLVKRLAQQSAATVPRIGRRVEEQRQAALANFTGMTDAPDLERLPLVLSAAHDAARNEALDRGARAVRIGDPTKGGEALIKGIDEYDTTARQAVDDLYAQARDLHDPSFDLSAVQDVARLTQAGVGAAGRQEGSTVRVSGALAPELDSVVKDILSLDPNVTRLGETGAFDQLKALRSRLFDLTQPAPGQPVRSEHMQARELYNALSDTLDAPVDGDDAFREVWRAASTEARKRFDTLDRLSTLRATQDFKYGTTTPYQAYQSIVKPGQFETLRGVRDALPTERWEEMRGAFKADLMGDAEMIATRLSEYDKPTLDLLLTPREQVELGRVSDAMQALQDTGIKEALRRQSEPGRVAYELLNRSDSRGIDELVKVAGGRNTPAGRGLRAGLIDAIVSKAVKDREGSRFIDPTALRSEIKSLSESGALTKVLLPADVRRLRDLATYTEAIETTGDSGTSLLAGQTVAGAFDMKANALMNLADQMFIGRMMTTELGARALFGTGGKRWDARNLRLFGAALGALVADGSPPPDSAAPR